MEGKDQAYFGYYGQFHNQQNMLSDQIRTGTYHNAIVRNPEDFKNKVVLDVGAGTGILSYFSAVAGAKTVYAVEASDIATSAKILLDNSHYGNKIHVLKGKMEEVEIKEKVDVIVSEPMGVLLVHERMMESFLVARDLYLKPGGKMYPSSSSIYLSPFSDHLLHSDTLTKTRFWHQNDFYGLDLNCLASAATNHLFSQPVVGCFDPRSLMANIIQRNFDFLTLSLDELKNFTIDLNFVSNFTGVVHGLAGWFDVFFDGSETKSVLSTSPFGPKTHWYQVRFLLKNPIAVNSGQTLQGKMHLMVNENRSYNIKITLQLKGTPIKVEQDYFLHEQQYWYPNIDPSSPMHPESFNLYQNID